jgi:hypothetical protein
LRHSRPSHLFFSLFRFAVGHSQKDVSEGGAGLLPVRQTLSRITARHTRTLLLLFLSFSFFFLTRPSQDPRRSSRGLLATGVNRLKSRVLPIGLAYSNALSPDLATFTLPSIELFCRVEGQGGGTTGGVHRFNFRRSSHGVRFPQPSPFPPPSSLHLLVSYIEDEW